MKNVEQQIEEYLKERDWDNLRPGDLAKSISIEAAELLEVFQWSNPEIEEIKQDEKNIEKIKKELADVLIYALQVSIALGFDTEQIILDKLEKAKEKYPAHLFKGKDRAKRGTEDIYWQIKREHRAKGE